MEKFVIFDNAAAVVSDEPWFPISIFPFSSTFGGDAGSGELDGLAEDGFVGEGNLYSFRWNVVLEFVCWILSKE